MVSTLASTFYRDNFSYQGVMGRRQYWMSFFTATVICLLLLGSVYLPTVLMLGFDTFSDVQKYETANWIASLTAGSILVYVGICMMFAGARRIRDAGLKPWLAFILVPGQAFPILGIVFFVAMIVLCALPSKTR